MPVEIAPCELAFGTVWLCVVVEVLVHRGAVAAVVARLTIQTVVDSNRVERLAADGASIGLLSPGADACIVNYMVTAIEGSHYVEMVRIALSGLRGGRRSGVDGSRVALRRGRGVRQRIQTYDTLVGLRHDADCDDRRQKLMNTCKRQTRYKSA